MHPLIMWCVYLVYCAAGLLILHCYLVDQRRAPAARRRRRGFLERDRLVEEGIVFAANRGFVRARVTHAARGI
jgi:hypothetical protein